MDSDGIQPVLRFIARNFVRGVAITLPVVLTVYVAWQAVTWVDGWLGLAIQKHGHRPAIVVFVLDHARGPVLVAPHAVFVDRYLNVLGHGGMVNGGDGMMPGIQNASERKPS